MKLHFAIVALFILSLTAGAQEQRKLRKYVAPHVVPVSIVHYACEAPAVPFKPVPVKLGKRSK